VLDPRRERPAVAAPKRRFPATVPHEPLISEDNWVKAKVRLIEELGAEPYLRNLLSVLKGNYPRGS